MKKQLLPTLLIFSSTSEAFRASRMHNKRKQQVGGSSASSLHYAIDNLGGGGGDGTTITPSSSTTTAQQKPSWVPMEIVELAAEDLQIPPSQFIQTYSDIEAYTSCDDDEDPLHECDFFGQYLGPTKWLHLTPLAQESGVESIAF